MQMARARTTTWDGYVQAFALNPHIFDEGCQRLLNFIECLNNSAFGLLNQLAKRSAFFGGDPADQFLASREGALLAGMPRAQLGQRTQFVFRFFQAEAGTLDRI